MGPDFPGKVTVFDLTTNLLIKVRDYKQQDLSRKCSDWKTFKGKISTKKGIQTHFGPPKKFQVKKMFGSIDFWLKNCGVQVQSPQKDCVQKCLSKSGQ